MAQKWKLKVGIPIRFIFILVFHLKNGTLLLKIASYTYITNTKQQVYIDNIKQTLKFTQKQTQPVGIPPTANTFNS